MLVQWDWLGSKLVQVVQSSVPVAVVKAAFQLEKGELSDFASWLQLERSIDTVSGFPCQVVSELGVHLVQRTG